MSHITSIHPDINEFWPSSLYELGFITGVGLELPPSYSPLHRSEFTVMLRTTLDGVLGFKFLGTNLDSFEGHWILWVGTMPLDPSLHLGSPNHELSFNLGFLFLFLFLGLNQLIFPSKWCHVGLASICHFLVLDPHLKAMGPIYGS